MRNVFFINTIFISWVLFVFVISPYASKAQPTTHWNKRFTMPSITYSYGDATIDNDRNIIIACNAFDQSTSTQFPVIIKYDVMGNQVLYWEQSNVISLYPEYAVSVVTDNDLNIYLATRLDGFPADSGRLIKIDGFSGAEIRSLSIANGGAMDMEIDDNFLYYLSSPNTRIEKYDTAFQQIWSYPLTAQAPAMLIINNPFVFTVGESVISSTDTENQIAKYDTAGNLIWSKSVNPSLKFDKPVEAICINTDKLLLTGRSISSFSNANLYIAEIDSNSVQDTVSNNSAAFSQNRLDISSSGSAYLLYSRSGTTSTDYDLIKYSNLNQAILATIDSGYAESVPYLGADLIARNNEIITCVGVLSPPPGIIFNRNYLLSSYDTLGNENWNITLGNGSFTTEQLYKLFIDSNIIYITGLVTDTVTNLGEINVIKLDYITATVTHTNPICQLYIYPNPVIGNKLMLSNYVKNSSMRIVDALGRIIMQQTNFSGAEIIMPHVYKPGIYNLVIENNTGITSVKLIIN
jgi:hypothetical protein